jgi:hypothetical protein
MGEVVYRPRVEVTRERGADRTATMPAGERIGFGVHGEIAAHYGYQGEVPNPVSTTIDYIVAAAAG